MDVPDCAGPGWSVTYRTKPITPQQLKGYLITHLGPSENAKRQTTSPQPSTEFTLGTSPVISFLKKLFGGEPKPLTVLDEVKRITVSSYRSIGAQRGCAPTAKTSDEKVWEIATLVGTAFRQTAEKRAERIPALNLNFIVFKFLNVYEMMGEQMLQEHLQYEVDRYLALGLRRDYLRELPLVK